MQRTASGHSKTSDISGDDRSDSQPDSPTLVNCGPGVDQARGQARRRAARPRQLSGERETNREKRLTQASSYGDDLRVRFPWHPQGYTRTCAQCGSIWQVPTSARRWWRSRLAYRFLARSVVFAGLAAGGDPAKVDTMVESISARKRLAESLRHCPKCGADHFTQRASRGELPY